MNIAGDIIIYAGIIFMVFGVIGIFKFNNFYIRSLVATKIDTVGAFTLILGLAVKHGFSFFSLKLLVILILMMVLNPLITHIVVRFAHLSGHEINKSGHQVDEDES